MSLRRWREESENVQLTLLPVLLATKQAGSEPERRETDRQVTGPGRSCGK